MRDFTLTIYHNLLAVLYENGYRFTTLDLFTSSEPLGKSVVLRHDVDKLPFNAFQTALLENKMEICATYYFRMIDGVYKPATINKISGLGHEIGYHYENMDTCKGDTHKALQDFKTNLDKLGTLVPVKTACMHGSPLSQYDNRKIWEKYDYRDFGIIAEPYFDINYNDVFYITDTGRSWNNESVSVRDKVNSGFDINIKNTHHLIELIKTDQLPDKIMINVHPQRWHDKVIPWTIELLGQNIKNIAKKVLVKLMDG